MRILVDTNVYISAFAFRSRQLIEMIEFVYIDHELVMTRYVADEILRVVSTVKPDQLATAMEFLTLPGIVWFEGTETIGSVPLIRDQKDLPIVIAGIAAGADVIISGDKDFLAVTIDRPKVMTPRDFIDGFINK